MHTRKSSLWRRSLGLGVAAVVASASVAVSVCAPASAFAAEPSAPSEPAAPSAPSAAARYVAVGDSFASGIGLPLNDKTPWGRECTRSLLDYAHILAYLKSWALTDATCSGATLTKGAGTGRGGFWESPHDAPSAPSMISQITKDTKYVTIQMGGNDSGVSNAFIACVEAGYEGPPRTDNVCQKRHDEGLARYRIDFVSMDGALDRALKAIRLQAPEAQVAVVGYSRIMPDDSSQCHYNRDRIPGSVGVGPISQPDVTWFRSQFVELNRHIAAVAAKNADTYVDTYYTFDGHDSCKFLVNWMFGVPALVFNCIPDSTIWASAHPNLRGHLRVAYSLFTTFSD